MSTPLLGRTLDNQARQIVYNVYSYFKARKLDPSTYEYQQDINLIDVISNVTQISKSSVTRIIRAGNQMKLTTGVVNFNKEKVKHVRKKRIDVDEFTEGIIRRKVIQFYTVQKEVPSVRKLNALLKKEKILNCSNEYLRQLLYKLGFTNTDTESSGMMVERRDIVSQRFVYVQAMIKHRTEDRSIFLLNDTSLWDSKNSKPKTTEMPGIVAVHVSGSKGFLDNELVMLKFKSISRSEKHAKYEHFDIYDWIKDTFLSNIPPSSVVVTNIPFGQTNFKKDEEKPTMASTRSVMQNWLKKYKIPFRDIDTKADLFQLICNCTITQENNIIDKIIKEQGHDILFLPLNHRDLNPTIVAWDEHDHKDAPKIFFANYPKEKWQKCFDKVKVTENEYYEHDKKFDETVDNLLSTVKSEPHVEENTEEEDDDAESDVIMNSD